MGRGEDTDGKKVSGEMKKTAGRHKGERRWDDRKEEGGRGGGGGSFTTSTRRIKRRATNKRNTQIVGEKFDRIFEASTSPSGYF